MDSPDFTGQPRHTRFGGQERRIPSHLAKQMDDFLSHPFLYLEYGNTRKKIWASFCETLIELGFRPDYIVRHSDQLKACLYEKLDTRDECIGISTPHSSRSSDDTETIFDPDAYPDEKPRNITRAEAVVTEVLSPEDSDIESDLETTWTDEDRRMNGKPAYKKFNRQTQPQTGANSSGFFRPTNSPRPRRNQWPQCPPPDTDSNWSGGATVRTRPASDRNQPRNFRDNKAHWHHSPSPVYPTSPGQYFWSQDAPYYPTSPHGPYGSHPYFMPPVPDSNSELYPEQIPNFYNGQPNISNNNMKYAHVNPQHPTYPYQQQAPPPKTNLSSSSNVPRAADQVNGYSMRLIERNYSSTNTIHPLKEKPALPKGWECRLDPTQARPFYVDTYAPDGEKRCFWHPPKKEEALEDAPGWDKVCTIYGRIYWRHRASKIISYEHPLQCAQFMHALNGDLYLRASRNSHACTLWALMDLDRFKLDDTDTACQIASAVWPRGLLPKDAGDTRWLDLGAAEPGQEVSMPPNSPTMEFDGSDISSGSNDMAFVTSDGDCGSECVWVGAHEETGQRSSHRKDADPILGEFPPREPVQPSTNYKAPFVEDGSVLDGK